MRRAVRLLVFALACAVGLLAVGTVAASVAHYPAAPWAALALGAGLRCASLFRHVLKGGAR